MTIRPLLAADVDAVAEVDFAAFQDVALRHGTTPLATAVRESRAAVRHLLDADPFGGFVAEDDGRVVGCVHLDEYSPSIAELRSLAVEPAKHGRGIGRALVSATETLARRRGHACLFAVSNDEEFFNKFGYAVRHIPELDRERSEVSRYKGVFAKDLEPES
jgi:N-acetylglutamate synthase-like GNAT family acetyltransferase